MNKPAAVHPPPPPVAAKVSATRQAFRPPEKDMSDAEAARRIRAYVAEHPGSDAFDIGVALGLPWRRVKRIAGDLVSKGQLT